MSQKTPEAPQTDQDTPTSEAQTPRLTHLDKDGAARMVDISDKKVTHRSATAQATMRMAAETLTLLLDRQLPKGDALQVARVAGIMAAKRTWELIPLCHPIPLSRIEISFDPLDEQHLQVRALVQNSAQTGVEMEALTAVSITALTLYDMAKAVDPHMEILHTHLLQKSGGKRGNWQRT